MAAVREARAEADYVQRVGGRAQVAVCVCREGTVICEFYSVSRKHGAVADNASECEANRRREREASGAWHKVRWCR